MSSSIFVNNSWIPILFNLVGTACTVIWLSEIVKSNPSFANVSLHLFRVSRCDKSKLKDCEYYVNKFRKEAAQKIEEKTTDYIEETCNTYRDTEKTDCEKGIR